MQFGLESIAKSKDRFLTLAIQLGHGNESLTFEEAVEKVTNDKTYLFQNSEEIIEAYKDEIDNVIPRLKNIFHEALLTEQVLNVNVKPVPPGGGGIAYYREASADGRRNGKKNTLLKVKYFHFIVPFQEPFLSTLIQKGCQKHKLRPLLYMKANLVTISNLLSKKAYQILLGLL